jgi:predicted nicotinamide N-methyase
MTSPLDHGTLEIAETGLILENTQLEAPRLVPEVSLHLAAEDLPFFRMGEGELAERGLGVPYWAFAWAGGQALARYVLDNPEIVRGRRVLDFGAGSGLVGIAAAKAGAFDVVASEIDPLCALAVRLNAEANDVYLDVVMEDVIGETDGGHEVILVGDVCYDAEIAARLIPWLEALDDSGRTVLIGDPGRFYLPKLGLERIAHYHAPTTAIMEDSDLRNAGVWRFSRTADILAAS